MIQFRQKQFNLLSDIINGAAVGGSIGSIVGFFDKRQAIKGGKDNKDNKDTTPIDPEKTSKLQRGVNITGIGMLIGAALGALASGIKEVSKVINKKTTVDRRLMQTLISILKKDGLIEGRDYTRDPKVANNMKSKVCIAITKNSGG